MRRLEPPLVSRCAVISAVRVDNGHDFGGPDTASSWSSIPDSNLETLMPKPLATVSTV